MSDNKTPISMRSEKEVSDEYWEELNRIKKFNSPKLSKLRNELRIIRNQKFKPE